MKNNKKHSSKRCWLIHTCKEESGVFHQTCILPNRLHKNYLTCHLLHPIDNSWDVTKHDIWCALVFYFAL